MKTVYVYFSNESGSSGDDQIVLSGDQSVYKALGGNDYVSVKGYANTIYGGENNDTINVSEAATIYGESGNDYIAVENAKADTVLVNGGTGNDTVYLDNSYRVLIQYSSGDGNDIVYGFSSSDTLQIGNGNGTYTKETVGDDVIITVGEGKISLIGASSLLSNSIDGEEIFPIWRISGTTATYGTPSNTLITVTGVKSLDGISLSGSTVTVYNDSLNQRTVTINDGYTLKLGYDVTTSQVTAAGWSLNNTTATYKNTSTSAGYKLANNQISYVNASGGNTLVTVSGVKSTSGLSLSGSTVTVSNNALNQSNVTISDGYTLALGSDIPSAKTTPEGWTLSGTTATYKAAAMSEEYTLANNRITYKAASGGNTLVTVSGVKSVAGLRRCFHRGKVVQ